MTTDLNKALLRRFIEIWNTGDVAAADEFVAPDLLDHTLPPGLPPGLAGFKLLVGSFRAAFPDLSVTVDEVMAQGDKAAARVTFRGTHLGEFQGISATGNVMAMGAIGILRFDAGMTVEHWATLDVLGLLTQLGVVPTPQPVPYETVWPAHGAHLAGRGGDPAGQMALVRRFFDEVCNHRRLDLAEALYASNHRYHDPSIPGVADGPAGITQPGGPVVPYQTAFSDAHWHIEDVLSEGDVVVTRWVGTGTQDGDLPGIPAAGKQVRVPGIWFQRLAGDRIVESWQVWDTAVMLQQLGVIPAAESS